MPFGFDPQGQLVNDVNGQALRAVCDAMQQTLVRRLEQQGLSQGEIEETRRKALEIWLQAISAAANLSEPFTEAWIKGTMHMYSTEFFYLADSFARQICEDEERYIQHLIEAIIPSSIREVGEAMSPVQIYRAYESLFQNLMPLDLRLLEAEPGRVVMRWYSTAALTRIAPVYRDAFEKTYRGLIRSLFARVPELLHGKPAATVEEWLPEESVTEWRISWKQPGIALRYTFIGVVVSVLLVIVTFAANIPALGLIALLPV
ncbi:MAG TPA: hypothetical protein VJZ27_17080, partial [Aggregatilineales bacterium]|nr:hypothetical protein [Aggregatilineales bacterium]